jgi:hypothetical protein
MTARSRNNNESNIKNIIATFTLVAASALAIAPAANAQLVNTPSPTNGSYVKTPIEPTLHRVPQSLVPIFNRAGDLLRVAQSRSMHGPERARESYRLAVQDFRQFLATGGYSANVASTDGASVAGNTITASSAAADIRVIKAAAASTTESQQATINRLASLYDQATKNFMMGDTRTALLQMPSTKTTALNKAAKANRGYTKVAVSDSMPPKTNGKRAVKVVIYGSHQDQVAARAQGNQALQNAYNEQNQEIADQNASAQANHDQDVANQAAANQAALDQQAYAGYLNQGWNMGYAPYGYNSGIVFGSNGMTYAQNPWVPTNVNPQINVGLPTYSGGVGIPSFNPGGFNGFGGFGGFNGFNGFVGFNP